MQYGVAKIVEEEELAMQRTSNHDGAIESQASASEAFVAALVELLWAQLGACSALRLPACAGAREALLVPCCPCFASG